MICNSIWFRKIWLVVGCQSLTGSFTSVKTNNGYITRLHAPKRPENLRNSYAIIEIDDERSLHWENMDKLDGELKAEHELSMEYDKALFN